MLFRCCTISIVRSQAISSVHTCNKTSCQWIMQTTMGEVGRERRLGRLNDVHGRVITRDVNFREFYFSIREFQISRLVEYSKVTRQSAWTMHLMRECCNSVDITPRGCGWAAAPGKWSDGMGSCDGVKLQSAPVSLMYSDRLLSSQTHHRLWL